MITRTRIFPPARAALALVVLALPATAQSPMDAASFEAHTGGRTLFFYSNGEAYGVERYKPDRRVTWSFLDGQCKEGRWYQDGPYICFLYEDIADPQCWTFYPEGSGMRAEFRGEEGGTVLYQAGEADEPMQCVGPEVGA